MNVLFERFTLPDELREVIYNSPSVIIPTSKEVLFELIFGNEHTDKIEVIYDVQGRSIKEAEVVRCKNGESLGLTFTEILSPTESSILMYRNGIADLALDPADIDEGYIARKSTHTRGCSVDLTLVDMATHQEVDMGTIFDFMAPASWPDSKEVTERQQANRRILRDAMVASGFEPYEFEWWHFAIAPEPYPDTYFDFPIK